MPRTEEIVLLGAEQRSVEDLAGTVLLERYRLLELLGEGGASVVYRAEHTIMHKPMAVKILRPEHVARPDLVRRFLGEARTVAKLRHENIVDIVDIGRTESGVVFCVMEWLDGEDLSATIERDGPMPWPRAQRVILQVCRALVAAHREGIVHRDVKPQNCFRIRRGRDRDYIKLLDFGIAKEVGAGRTMTATGVVMGTAGYMPPEQARGEPIDVRADVYAVGALLFELVSGRHVFEGNNYLDVLVAQLSRPAPKLSTVASDLPPGLEEVVGRALASKADDRYPSMTELATAIIHVDRAAAPAGARAIDVPPPAPAWRPEPVPAASSAPIELPQPAASWPSEPIVAASPAPIDVLTTATDGGTVIAAVPPGSDHRSGSHPTSPASDRRVGAAVLLGALLVPTAIVAIVLAILLGDPAAEAEPAAAAGDVEPASPLARSDPATPSTADGSAGAGVPNEERTRAPADGSAPAAPPAVASPSTESPTVGAEVQRKDDRRRRPDRTRERVPPTAPAARPPAGPSRAQVERRLQTACADRVGFEAKTVKITTHAEAAPKVIVDPPSAPLKKCVEQQLSALSLPRVAAAIAVKLRPKAAP